MDPTANLMEQFDIASTIVHEDIADDDVMRLAELVLALHEWIARGGTLPAQWRKPAAPLVSLDSDDEEPS